MIRRKCLLFLKFIKRDPSTYEMVDIIATKFTSAFNKEKRSLFKLANAEQILLYFQGLRRCLGLSYLSTCVLCSLPQKV